MPIIVRPLCVEEAVSSSQQAAFDASQPYRGQVQRWCAVRAELQRRGELPAGDAQARPAYLQVFVDDFLGCACGDRVQVPPSIRDLGITPVATRATGGVFPHADGWQMPGR